VAILHHRLGAGDAHRLDHVVDRSIESWKSEEEEQPYEAQRGQPRGKRSTGNRDVRRGRIHVGTHGPLTHGRRAGRTPEWGMKKPTSSLRRESVDSGMVDKGPPDDATRRTIPGRRVAVDRASLC